MIMNTDQVITLIKGAVSAFNNKVYREYPKRLTKTPFCTVSVIGRNSALVCDNVETVAEITYSVDVYTDKSSDGESYLSTIADTLLSYGAVNTALTVGLEQSPDIMHSSGTFRMALDKRGNTYNAI